ncbi:39S ribosomal protein L32, mitochondrial [Bicyclus anynana]|uniref:Large ribosomal subunit protein bL32m n=1 Tax=Bicyclus anynana TaxID=110368 RepID=A0A6J1NS34_BICAN|nr:39S ribosomal protein L32, mitochondrial [Bicyclus anynana]XP_023950525.2 39S ribosomal protein L32, mitochondrial [Bicyclus anynana]XP_052740517.1 39S ribosomal protein L32, mitochondrial [Bicyclus anynana]
MISRVHHLKNIIKNVEKNILQIFGLPPRELALAYTYEKRLPEPKKFSIKDIVGDGILLAVPKFRRTVEKRLKRKFGSPEYTWKMLVPKTNIIVCNSCGHYHERGHLCAHCYKKVEAETKEIQDKIQQKLGNQKPIENDVIVLYNGESLPDQPKEFWRGKRIIEMKKDRPQWFSKNLLEKTTQQPSESKDVKPTDLA